jgi:hypothetical protein
VAGPTARSREVAWPELPPQLAGMFLRYVFVALNAPSYDSTAPQTWNCVTRCHIITINLNVVTFLNSANGQPVECASLPHVKVCI